MGFVQGRIMTTLAQRVYAGGRFGNVTNITVQNYHATMVFVDGEPFRPSEVSADVVEFPRRFPNENTGESDD